METKDLILKAIIELLYHRNNRFYAEFLLQINYQYSKTIPTAGVYINEKVNMIINPDFLTKPFPQFSELDEEVQTQQEMMEKAKELAKQGKNAEVEFGLNSDIPTIAELLVHEVRHILFEHIPLSKDLGITLPNDHKLLNLATDAVINVDLKKITEALKGSITVERLNKAMRKQNPNHVDMLLGQTSVYYYAKLKEHAEKYGEPSGYTIDDHGSFGNSSDSKEGIEEVVKRLTKNAKERAGGIGSVPSDLVAIVESMFKSKVNWKKELRKFVQASQKSDSKGSRSKRNRRYGILQSGKRHEHKQLIVFCIDTSGSMSDIQLARCWSEMVALHKNGVKIIVIEADAEVTTKPYDFTPRNTPSFKGRGGTAYQPAITKALEYSPDCIFYFGDMDASDIPNNPKVPFLWIVSGEQNPPAEFGKVIRIPKEE